ncbi:hypothetical protein FE782_14580 [Paenibacillus antri]|uniref:Uncharacterized protein n=1 Tax=Paenibacillus antri TaxID=2582848 RepID=A0A5R9GJC9_9BACL|nr:hypothetical protein [Paenibacillus antri]TLS51715.1 hypothetical protein FE782_14580 [Paenibacillus antri]
MSLFHYIASNNPLPLGETGGRKSALDKSGRMPTKAFHFLSNESSYVHFPGDYPSSICEDEIEVYETIEDAAGIMIYDLHQGYDTIRKHFKQPYVYGIAPNWGSFHFNLEVKELFPEDYRASVKCVTVLFDLMKKIGDDQAVFELYSCWIGEETQERNPELDTFIRLSIFTLGDQFELKERQYISLVK